MSGEIFNCYDWGGEGWSRKRGGWAESSLLLPPGGYSPGLWTYPTMHSSEPTAPTKNLSTQNVLRWRNLALDNDISISQSASHKHHVTGLGNFVFVMYQLAPVAEEEPSTIISMF